MSFNPWDTAASFRRGYLEQQAFQYQSQQNQDAIEAQQLAKQAFAEQYANAGPGAYGNGGGGYAPSQQDPNFAMRYARDGSGAPPYDPGAGLLSSAGQQGSPLQPPGQNAPWQQPQQPQQAQQAQPPGMSTQQSLSRAMQPADPAQAAMNVAQQMFAKGLVNQGQSYLEQGYALRGLQSQAQAQKLQQSQMQMDFQQRLLGSVYDQGSLENANALYQRVTGQQSPLSGQQYSPELIDQARSGLMTQQQRIDMAKSQLDMANKQSEIRAREFANMKNMAEAREKEAQLGYMEQHGGLNRQQVVANEDKLRDDYETSAGGRSEAGGTRIDADLRTIDMVRSLLQTKPSWIDANGKQTHKPTEEEIDRFEHTQKAADLQIQKLMSSAFVNAAGSGVRAYTDQKNFGSLTDKLAGLVAQSFEGGYTSMQRNAIAGVIDQLQNDVLLPARTQLQKKYADIALRRGLDPNNVIGPNAYGNVGAKNSKQPAGNSKEDDTPRRRASDKQVALPSTSAYAQSWIQDQMQRNPGKTVEQIVQRGQQLGYLK